MLWGEEHFDLLDEKLLEPDSVKLTMTISPVIYSIKRQHYYAKKLPEKENTPIWNCLFEIRTGKDKAFMLSSRAYGSHDGERHGPHWEETKRMWQSQYDYIRQYVGFAILSGGEVLIDEAQLVEGYPRHGYEGDWESLAQEVQGAIAAVLTQYREREAEARQEKDWPTVKSMESSWRAVNAVLTQVVLFFMRLQGRAYVNAGRSKTTLRFAPVMLEQLRCCYAEYREKWKGAAAIRLSRKGTRGYTDKEWENAKAVIKQVYDDMPDDLLDELRPPKMKWRYEAYKLALVHAARNCGVFVAEPHRWLRASNWRIISDELQKHARDIGEPIEIAGSGE